MAEITYYGADWCRDCRRSKALMDSLGVSYETKDVEKFPENAVAAEAISGRKNIPVIQFADGEFFVEPSDADLKSALVKRGLVA